MGKVDWITWKTEIEDIINQKDIMEKINELYNDFNYYMDLLVSEEIKFEINRGGLDRESLSILGTSPAYEEANNILNSITNINEMTEELQKQIENNIIEQKQIEKDQLIESIKQKLEQENKILENTIKLKDRMKNNSINLTEAKINDIISLTEERIKRLNIRLERAENI